MEEITQAYWNELKKILVNFKKSPNRRYTRKYLLEKYSRAKGLFNKIADLASLESDSKETKLIELNSLYGEIKKIIIDNLKTTLLTLKTVTTIILILKKLHRKVIKMAKVDLKLGTSLVTVYDGNPEGLSSFLDSVSLYKEHVIAENSSAAANIQQAAQAQLAKFIRTRLKGIARQVIPEVDDVDQIVNAVKQQCSPKVTSDNIIAKMNGLKQKQLSAEDFCSQVEKLSVQLKSTYIHEEIPIAKATKLATKVGVETLVKGANNNDVKLILKAGTFETLNDAILKFQQNDVPSSSSAAMLFSQQNKAKTKYTQNNKGNYNNFSKGKQNYKPWSQGNGPWNNNFSQNNGNFQQKPRYYQQGNNQPPRYNNYNNQQNNWRRPNMFMAHEQSQNVRQVQPMYPQNQFNYPQQHLNENSTPMNPQSELMNHFLGEHPRQHTQ